MREKLDAIETAETPEGEPAAARPAKTAPAGTAARPSSSPRPSRIPPDDDGDEDESFFQRHGVKIIIFAVVVLAIGSWIAFSKSSKPSAPARRPEPPMIMVRPLPPPPAPTPPPKVIPPPPKEEQKKDDKVSIPEDKPLEDKPAPPKPVEKPPEGLGTNIKGPGAGMAGLNAGGGNGMIGGTGTGPGGGNAGAWYAGQVQSKVAEALRNHRKTRNASFAGIKLVVTVNGTGQVTASKLLGSTGDSSIDDAIKNEALSELRLQDPPPGGKPMTVTLTLNARRPK